MSETRTPARRPGEGSHQPRQPAGQGHQGAGAEEIPRPAARLHGRRAEARHRRARPRLVDPHADLSPRPARGNAAVEKVAARTVALRRARAGSQRKSARRDHPPRQPADGGRRLRAEAGAACTTSGRQAGDVWVALDRVRDPGNLGTVIRTVDAVGAKGVILVGETTDPFSLETVRATMGSIFAVPVARRRRRRSWPGAKALPALRRRHASEGRGRLSHVDYRSRPVVLLMGNEQQGLPDELARACDGCCASRRPAAPIRSTSRSRPASCCSRSGAPR